MHLAMWPTPCTIGQVHLLVRYKSQIKTKSHINQGITNKSMQITESTAICKSRTGFHTVSDPSDGG